MIWDGVRGGHAERHDQHDGRRGHDQAIGEVETQPALCEGSHEVL